MKAAAIRQSDVPPDWQPSPDRNDIISSVAGATCATVKLPATHASSRVFVGTTSPEDSARVEDAVYVFKDAASAGAKLAAFQAPTAPTCLQTRQQEQLSASGSGLVVIGTSPLADLQGVGDDSVGHEIGAADQAQTMTFYADLVAVRVGRALLLFRFDSFEQPVAQRLDIVKAVAARIDRPAKT